MSEEEEDFDFDFEEEEEEPIEEMSELEEEEEEELPEIEEETEEEEAPPEEEPPISPQEIPLTIRVEVGEVEMSAEEFLKLGPGNTLSLERAVGQNVDLKIGDRCVAKGELIQMGDVLGVRILKT